MARPRKNSLPVSPAEREAAISKRIEETQSEIADAKEKISKLKKELIMLNKEKEEASLAEIREAIITSGKTTQEWLARITGQL